MKFDQEIETRQLFADILSLLTDSNQQQQLLQHQRSPEEDGADFQEN
jgi:hypothetical protein